jgi:hypothetical protein
MQDPIDPTPNPTNEEIDLRDYAEEIDAYEEGLRRRVMERLAEYNATDAILTLFEKHPRIVERTIAWSSRCTLRLRSVWSRMAPRHE